jgi:hypothetical protein
MHFNVAVRPEVFVLQLSGQGTQVSLALELCYGLNTIKSPQAVVFHSFPSQCIYMPEKITVMVTNVMHINICLYFHYIYYLLGTILSRTFCLLVCCPKT